MESFKVHKSYFLINYKPKLTYYDTLFKSKDIFNDFIHWNTDRLRITLFDNDKLNHSLTMQFNSILYETDNYKKTIETDIINKVNNQLPELVENVEFLRIGHRFIILFPLNIKFEELTKIFNLKIYNEDFMNLNDDCIVDNTVHFDVVKPSISYNIKLGTIKKQEISKFITRNVQFHFSTNEFDRHRQDEEYFKNFSDVSLFLDIDIFKLENDENKIDIINFLNESNLLKDTICKKLESYLFK